MPNRPSRIVISIPTASYDGRYWGRYPHGDKPVAGAELVADAIAQAAAIAQLSAAIRLGASPQAVAAASAALSTAIRLSAAATDVASASASFGDSLANNAYSDYTTFWVNHETGSAANSGLSELSPKATINQALALCSGNGGERIIVRGDHTLTAHVISPVGGVSDAARLVIMGHPDYAMPVITLGSFNFRLSANGSRPFTVIRKFHLTAGQDVSGIDVGINNHQDDFRGEWLQVNNLRRTGTDNQGCIYLKDGAAARAHLHHVKLGDNKTNAGEWYTNGPGVLSYNNAGVIIEFFEIFDCDFAIRWKRPMSGVNPGPKIRYGIMRNVGGRGVMFQNDTPHSGSYDGAEICWNLFYAVHNASAGTGGCVHVFDSSNQTNQVDVYQNTFAEDAGTAQSVLEFYGAKFRLWNNIIASPNRQVTTKLQSASVINRALKWDYNSYFAGGQYRLGEYAANETPLSGFSALQSAKTNTNHPDLSDLPADPEPNGRSFSSLADTFVAHASRNYTVKATSSLKGAGEGGVDPGYDPAKCGAGI